MKRSAKVVAAVLIVAASLALMAQTYPSARFSVLIVDTWATITNGLTLYTGTNVWVLTPAATGDTPLELNPVGTTTGGFRWWRETSVALPASFAPGSDFNTLGAFLGNPYDGTRCDGSSANCQWAGLFLRPFTPPVLTNALYNTAGTLYWGHAVLGGATAASVEAVTTTKTPDADQAGEVYTNEGDADGATVTLPTAAVGLSYTVYVQAAQTLTVTAATGDVIRIAGNVTATGGSVTSAVVGSSMTLVAINATEWVATAVTGSWTF